MMKKMLFFALFLLILGAANLSSQVRIGGNGVPNGAAVLDLNATDVINTGTKGLALPRVTLGSNTALLTTGVSNLNGMLIYNTGGSLSAGIYYWNGSQWQPVMNGALAEQDSVIGNEVVNATTGRGLVRAGAGTTASPYTLGIADNGIITSMITDKAVLPGKIGSAAADSGLFLMSTGSGATFNYRYNGMFQDTVVVMPRVGAQVTWRLSLDTIVILTGRKNKYGSISAPGLTLDDLCLSRGVTGLLYVWADGGRLYYASMHGYEYNGTIRLRCYRSSW